MDRIDFYKFKVALDWQIISAFLWGIAVIILFFATAFEFSTLYLVLLIVAVIGLGSSIHATNGMDDFRKKHDQWED